ncbi:hypothetical protein O3P69_007110 [Scylla paramamosain]|uniref:Uncharacterized protein n=1 Tax=Scylla paramamosain TaxID=85552 RepID=A0AAW0V3V8_SCYPA
MGVLPLDTWWGVGVIKDMRQYWWKLKERERALRPLTQIHHPSPQPTPAYPSSPLLAYAITSQDGANRGHNLPATAFPSTAGSSEMLRVFSNFLFKSSKRHM